MVDEHKPDIIIGCETHLDETYTSSEVFPQSYSIIRKDRCCGGGGVFLAISQSIPFLNVSMTTNAEMIWANIFPVHGEPISICSFYRPPDNNGNPMEDLKTALSMVTNVNNIILAGDFNLPSIIWKDGIGQIGVNPVYGREVNSMFLDIVNEFGLEQQVYECTRENHILDLVFVSQPNPIQ